MPAGFGPQEQLDEGGVEWTQPWSHRRLWAGFERLEDLRQQVQLLDIRQRHHAHQGESSFDELPTCCFTRMKVNVCVAAEHAGAAQRQRPAGCSAGRHHSATVLWYLHGERLGRDADLQFLPVTCAASRGRADHLQLLALLLLGDDLHQHAVCWITFGWERLLSGVAASCGCNCSIVTHSRGKYVWGSEPNLFLGMTLTQKNFYFSIQRRVAAC